MAIVVGSETDKKTFAMPKALLCKVSPCFVADFEGEFAEPSLQQLELPAADQRMSKYFEHRTYTT